MVSAACALFGVVNCWKCKLIAVFAANVPAVNKIFNTLVLTMLAVHADEPVAPDENWQLGEDPTDGDPVRVMRMPALEPALMALVRVKATVAVVGVLLTGLPSVTARLSDAVITTRLPADVLSIIAPTAFVVAAATFVR